ncbi:MAG: DNA topoisomerase IB [Gemmatimonadaceae bacterium]
MKGKWLLRQGKKPGQFEYASQSGVPSSAARAAQIDALAVPPAWTDVHVAASERSAIQAWGYDSRGRKQYRYHPRAVQRGQLKKYYRVRQMARDLPELRRKVYTDFKKRGFPKARVLAGIVRFLADGFFRIGNERYAKENHTFGLTTLKKSHVTVDGDVVTFDFIGKRSIRHKKRIASRDLARFVEGLLQTPGRRLFRYQEGGVWHDVESADVNQYIQSLAGFPYSAKDFRTWGGTLRAATVLADLGPAKTTREAEKNVVTAMRFVAAELGNTPTICRKSYVHPAVLDRYVKNGATITWRTGNGERRSAQWEHEPEELALIEFLDEHFPERRKSRRSETE